MNREVLDIGVSEIAGARVLRLTGDLDSYTSDRLAAVSKTWVAGAKKIIVDLDALEYVDSAGLSALVGVWVRARESGAQMVVSCRNPRIHRVLEITGLLNLFTLVNGESDTKAPPGTSYGRKAVGPAGEQRPQAGTPPGSGGTPR
ncbi:MAG TPA: STAS domain-containing protein [Armatimonadota bacterium]|nr:STAS domain-containing protein [Armatimonadota bacterium]